MCGFVGYLSSSVTDAQVIKTMSDVIAHRGPDDCGYYDNGYAHFGFRRLSIIDVQEGAQPIYNATNDIVIIFNGEIYNYKELRSELIEEGYTFKTHTDTEVILHGYEAWGEEGVLSKLRGMFAFTIWDDNEKNCLVLVIISALNRSTTRRLVMTLYLVPKSNLSCHILRLRRK